MLGELGQKCTTPLSCAQRARLMTKFYSRSPLRRCVTKNLKKDTYLTRKLSSKKLLITQPKTGHTNSLSDGMAIVLTTTPGNPWNISRAQITMCFRPRHLRVPPQSAFSKAMPEWKSVFLLPPCAHFPSTCTVDAGSKRVYKPEIIPLSLL